jgi:hypothetical protein
MRIDQFGLEIKLEARIKLNIFGTKFYGESLSFLNELSRKKWIKNWVNVLAYGFNHENFTVVNSHFDSLKPILLRKLNDFHITSFFTFNPFLTLKLWINKKWISVAGNDNRSVFERNSISWKPLSLPNSLIS